MKKLAGVLAATIAFCPAISLAETVWQSPDWSVNKRDAQNDEDDYSCQMVGKFFNVVVSAENGTGSLELPILDGQGKVPNVEFSIYVKFDGGSRQMLRANHIAEYETTVAPLPDLAEFVELVARSKIVEISGGGVDRTVSLKGSRVVANAFKACLGTVNRASAKFVNSEIYYGSRVGMSATVIGEISLNSSLAEIRIKHTRDNAKAFCEGYALDTSEKCVNDTMANVKVEDRVFGNCQTGEFSDASGMRYRFEGKNSDPNVMADFRLRSLQDDQILDGSSASGYGTAMGVLKALCPARSVSEGWN